MKILVITSNVGRTAPGIVFERLIHGLAERHDLDLLAEDYDPSLDFSGVIKNLLIIKKRKLHPRIFKAFISLFGLDPFDILWKRKAIRRLKSLDVKYDVIFSLISFHHYSPLITGYALATNLKNVKFIVYSVDAIPAPLGWSKNDAYFKSVRKLMSNYNTKTDVFFSANEQMLEYQLSLLNVKSDFKSQVLYNINFGDKLNLNKPSLSQTTFLYTGGIYQVRKVDYILEAFERYREIDPSSRFVFVGSNLPEDILNSLDEDTRKSIEIHPFTRDLTNYYNEATALIDIDADLKDDVFLSSKIVNYLNINRYIISETGSNSPSRHLFKGIDSIIQCDHNVNELYNAMLKVKSHAHEITFDDRDDVIKLFDIKTNISSFEQILK